MVKLLVLADDCTGALDCGTQLKVGGANVCILMRDALTFESIDSEVEAVVINTETRHLPPDKAKAIVRDLSLQAARHGVPYLYKKTDSALRGNIGSELEGVLEGTCSDKAYFVPAFPSLNRTTRLGIQYVGNVPLKDSAFGRDPFEPATDSEVASILKRQTDITVRLVQSGDAVPETNDDRAIFVFDAETNDDLERLSAAFQTVRDIRVYAGCSGFAAYLPEMLRLNGGKSTPFCSYPGLLAVSATLSEAAAVHFRHASEAGFDIIRLSTRQKLSAFSDPAEAKPLTRSILERFQSCGRVIVTGEEPSASEQNRLETGRQIAKNLGVMVRKLYEAGFQGVLLGTGGDTLQGILEALDCSVIIPEYEIEPGVELSRAIIWNGSTWLVTKAGSFGSPDVYRHIDAFLTELSGQSGR